MKEVLRVKKLNVSFDVPYGEVKAVRGVTFSLQKGEILALVGESGCGKSATARAVLKLHDSSGVHMNAEELILLDRDILQASERDMLSVRGKTASMVFQDPLTYLNPTMKVGRQVTEALYRHGDKSASECRMEAVRLLELVQIPQAEIRAGQYPHQYSGGMRQRAMIAMALACGPELLIADEPTTALDPTIQLQILGLLKKMQQEFSMAVLFITHDLSVVANTADRVAVMYAGEIVETGNVQELFSSPAHPYTKGLLQSLPSIDKEKKLYTIDGAPPDLSAPLQGCAFAPRCEHCMNICLRETPPNQELKDGHEVSCWLLHPKCPKGGR